MRTWLAFLLAALIIAVLWFFVPATISEVVANLMVCVCAIWVYFNAKKLDITKYKSNLSMSPLAIAFFTVFLWPIFFPAYLGLNWRIRNKKQLLKETKK
jgi:hypothetical protein